MKLELKIYDCLCACEKFEINDIHAHSEDFGSLGDRNPEEAEDYSCGNRRFERVPPSEEVLEKYNISEEEYQEVANKLEEGLSFGSCGLCS